MTDYLDAELSLVAGLVSDRHLVNRALIEGFKGDLLTLMPVRLIAEEAVRLHDESDAPIDARIVQQRLAERGLWSTELEHYFAALADRRIPSAAEVVGLVDQLKARDSRARLASLRDRMGAYIDAGAVPSHKDFLDFISEMMRDLLEIQRRRVRRQREPVRETLKELRHHLVSTGGRERGLLGYSIAPFARLNNLLSGLRRGFYYGLAGAPRRGKTNLALELAASCAAANRVPVLFYTWEQTRRVLAARYIAKELMVSPASILTGGDEVREALRSMPDAWKRLEAFMDYVFVIEGGRHDTVERIKAQAYEVMHRLQTDQVVIFLDYLQKIPLEETIEDPKARTDEISTQLAELSLDLNAPVFTISPLDKDGCRLDERPPDDEGLASVFTRPTMHHCVGSGDLEYDLDVAMVLAKDWGATRDLRQLLEAKAASREITEDIPLVDIINLHLDKNRDAPEEESHIVQFAFLVHYNKFIELGYKAEREYERDFHGFAKIQEVYERLREIGVVRAPAASVGA